MILAMTRFLEGLLCIGAFGVILQHANLSDIEHIFRNYHCLNFNQLFVHRQKLNYHRNLSSEPVVVILFVFGFFFYKLDDIGNIGISGFIM